MGGARCPQWQNYFLGFVVSVFPNDTQHFMTGVANLTQNCKELLLMTPLTFPLMETVLNTASGKQSLYYSSLDTELHSHPHGISLVSDCCANSLNWLLKFLMVSVAFDYLKKTLPLSIHCTL